MLNKLLANEHLVNLFIMVLYTIAVIHGTVVFIDAHYHLCAR